VTKKTKAARKATKVFLVVYEHRFGNDYNVYTTKKKALKAIEELKKSEMFEPHRDESVSLEELWVDPSPYI